MLRTVRLSIIRSLFTVHSAMVYVIHVCRQLSSRSICSCSKAAYKPVWHIPLLSVQWINAWRWTGELSETCRISCQHKFVKWVHLVGFIINNFVTMHGHMNSNILSCILPNIYQSFIRDSSQNIWAVDSSETSVYFHQTTRLHVLEDVLIHVYRSVTSDLSVTPSSPLFRQQLWYNEIKLTNCRYIHRYGPKKAPNEVTPHFSLIWRKDLLKFQELIEKFSDFLSGIQFHQNIGLWIFQKQIWK
jgi:hypothetical protein